MYQWLAQSLGNVSVNRKLGLGFGLVLLLTLAITLTGWHGMDSIIDRGDKLGNISDIQQYTQELRIARQHYERRRDDASVAELEKALANLDRQVQLMLGLIEHPADRQRLEQQREAVRQSPDRELGDIEAGVLLEQRVGHPVGNTLPRQRDLLPALRAAGADQ